MKHSFVPEMAASNESAANATKLVMLQKIHTSMPELGVRKEKRVEASVDKTRNKQVEGENHA